MPRPNLWIEHVEDDVDKYHACMGLEDEESAMNTCLYCKGTLKPKCVTRVQEYDGHWYIIDDLTPHAPHYSWLFRRTTWLVLSM